VLLGLVGTPLLLAGIGALRPRSGGEQSPLYLAGLIALGIGLHNLGEGLAIGTSYASGEIALGTFLVVGFLLHNTTEGLGIVAPLGQARPTVLQLLGLGAVAGVPTVLGAWIGGFTYSPVWTTLFFAIGAGAIAQVVFEILKLFRRRPEGVITPLNVAGALLGMILMYATGLIIPA
jgi:zinc transporter ZupT